LLTPLGRDTHEGATNKAHPLHDFLALKSLPENRLLRETPQPLHGYPTGKFLWAAEYMACQYGLLCEILDFRFF
jgi:hypothetical protein